MICYDDFDTIFSSIARNHYDISKYAISPIHDKDIKSIDDDGNIVYKEPHYHVLLVLYRARSINGVQKLLGLSQNVFGENIKDKYSAFEYLSHNGFDDKVTYDIDKVFTNTLDYFTYNTNSSKLDERNMSTMNIIDDLIVNVPFRELVCRYGRDFVIHFKEYYFMSKLIKMEEHINTDSRDGIVNVCKD